ncbi:hypothetical protein [Mariniblastus fucicola]|uniref:Uncharacterized protein n=1 Tax=Mariniblastus fucicola TaxID=980251 RepID=A0A5B9PF50_9BACT|nr:hypothetical protein [Mariniblastus fucicola]QEG21533.1 hypothetical protein MFFC18_13890 [Mariniblastus fucicola]
MLRFVYTSTILLIFLFCVASVAQAQRPSVNTTVQLPTVSNFSINTVVSVPDGGTMYIGGIGRGSEFATRRPNQRSSSRSVAGPGVSISASLIVGSEVDAELERRGRLAIARKARPSIHGTAAEKAKASFLAKHLGRGWK